MKCIDFNEVKAKRKKKKNKKIPAGAKTQFENNKKGVVIQSHAMLKNELKLYRRASTSPRLGVLRKYEELITMARKK
jgi:hypothetical protein